MCGKLSYPICFVLAISLVAAREARCADASLVGWWKFEEASGALHDEGDYNNDGTGNGVVYQQSGQEGYALGFDGIDDTVVIGANGRPSDTFTFGGWFKTSSAHEIDAESTTGTVGTSGQKYAFDPAHGGDFNGGAGLSVGTNGISVYEHGSGYMPATAVYAAEIGDEWNHIMVVYNSKQPTIYLNGEVARTGLASPRAIVHAPIQLGGMAYGYFEGLMDEVRIYNRVLTQAEIAGLAALSWATAPSPANGSDARPSYWGDNVYMMLDYVPGSGAITNTAYFSDNIQAVIDRDGDHSLGSVPPWPVLSETAFVVGYDDEAIPAYARAPLVGGRTYYWCVDTDDGATVWLGAVWSFRVMPTYAWGPDPADGAELVPTDTTLSWNLGDVETDGYSVRYNLYVGTDEAAIEAIANGDTASPEYVGTVEMTSGDIAGLEPETEHFWRVDTRRQEALPPFPLFYETGEVWSFTTAPPGVGGILREWWDGIGGVLITDLTNSPDYPDNPTGSEIVTLFEGPASTVDPPNDYGSRLHGWLYVAQTGDYTFWIATDDAGELWLSTDSDPANASLIAYVTGWVPYGDFDGNAGVPGPGQMSAPIHLVGGEQYYISGLMKEGGGGDHISVAWQGPDSGGVREIIPGNHLKAYVPIIAQNPDPADGSADAALDVTLGWTAGIDEDTDMPYTTQHVYVGSDPVAVANATTASPEYMGGPTGPNEYGPLSLSYYEQVYWRIDGVAAETGTVLYPGSVWTFKATHNPANIVDANLKLWLRLEDNALDSSGYGRDGTEYGGPTYVAGSDGQAINLDGIDDYVEIEYNVGISGDDARTIAVWAKAGTTVISDWANVFGFCPGWEGNYQYFDIEKIGGANQYCIHIHGEQWALLDVDLEWHHLAVTYQPGWAEAYVDGESLIGLDTTGAVLSTVDKVRMGYRPSQNAYFPGSVDDARIYDIAKDAAGIAEIMRIDLSWAWAPVPAHGAVDVDRDVVLSWTAGVGATAHTVYFGVDDPGNMVQVAGPSTSTTYNPPGTLDLGKTYYWSVVESPGGATGRTWKFTVSNYLVVDDMESYTPWTTPGNNIFETWLDGFGDCAGSGNTTGAVLTENADPVLAGIQSMKYEFDNDGTVFSPCDSAQIGGRLKYSKAEVQTSDLPSGIGSDWTVGGVRALYVPFYGQAGNATTESLWVQLQDGSKGYGDKVFYGAYEGESLDDFNEASWHEWNIDLADFGVDLNDVESITIGIGDETKDTAFGSGTLYFDEIRLYAPRCMPQRAKPAADFDDSCQVDYPDIAAMFEKWLVRDIIETAWSGAWQSADIGDVNEPGAFADLGSGAYSMTAGGDDIWNQADAFLYAYQPVSGDCQLTVRITGIEGPSTNEWRKAGVMIRETLDANSPHAFMTATAGGGGGQSFQWRPARGGDSQNSDGPAGVTLPTCVRILRIGDTFRGFHYRDGEWIQQGSAVTIPMAENVYIGMALTSHDYANPCTATFDRTCSDEFLPMDLSGGGEINFIDYATLMSQWLDKVFWP